VKDTWNDRLSDNSVTSIVDQAGSKDIQAFNIHQLQDSQTINVMVSLSEARVIVDLSQVLEGEGLIDGEREKDLV
jgi:hypothetical protein